MQKLFQPSSLIALVALIVALGGTATAASVITSKQIKNGTVTGADVKNNSLTGADVKNNSLTGADVRNSSLTGSDIKNGSITAADVSGIVGQAGPAGPQGARGAQGAQGPQGAAGAPGTAVAWALVNGSNGTLVRRSGNIAVSRIAEGTYCITAPGGGIAVATLSTVSGGEEIYVSHGGLAGCPDSANFGVQTVDEAGPDADSNFSIMIDD